VRSGHDNEKALSHEKRSGVANALGITASGLLILRPNSSSKNSPEEVNTQILLRDILGKVRRADEYYTPFDNNSGSWYILFIPSA